jgi:hypothetical protein
MISVVSAFNSAASFYARHKIGALERQMGEGRMRIRYLEDTVSEQAQSLDVMQSTVIALSDSVQTHRDVRDNYC